MEKTEMMKKFEEETGQTLEEALERWKTFEYYSKYLQWLEELFQQAQSKASAYDRLMSRGKHDITLKELANILNMIIVANKEGRLIAFDRVPTKSSWGGWYAQDVYCVYWGVPLPYKGYDKDWENSLTLPDGWEE